jgi:hypothetical protein
VSDCLCKIEGMNLNRAQFLKAVERGQALLKELKKDYPELKLTPVFSRFGARSGQCDLTTDLRKIAWDFTEMFGAGDLTYCQNLQESEKKAIHNISCLRFSLVQIKKAEESDDREAVSKLRKESNEIERRLLNPELNLYRGDVLIEYRSENLIYESLRRLQQDSRLPPGLNTVGNIRVIAGSLEFLSREV